MWSAVLDRRTEYSAKDQHAKIVCYWHSVQQHEQLLEGATKVHRLCHWVDCGRLYTVGSGGQWSVQDGPEENVALLNVDNFKTFNSTHFNEAPSSAAAIGVMPN